MGRSEDTEDLFSAAMIAKMNEQNELVIFFEMIRKKTITFVNLLVIRNLLELGYTPNDRDDYGIPPIVYAAKKGSLNTIKLLLRHGALIDLPSRYQETALTSACMKKRYDVIKYLTKKGAEINHVDHTSLSPLRWAAKYEDMKMLKILIKGGASLITDMLSHPNVFDIVQKHESDQMERYVIELFQAQSHDRGLLPSQNNIDDSILSSSAKAKQLQKKKTMKAEAKVAKMKTSQGYTLLHKKYRQSLVATTMREDPCAPENNQKRNENKRYRLWTWIKRGKMKWTSELKASSYPQRHDMELDRTDDLTTPRDKKTSPTLLLPQPLIKDKWHTDPRWKMVFQSLKDDAKKPIQTT